MTLNCKWWLLLLLICGSLIVSGCDTSPRVITRPGTRAHMEQTKPSITEWDYQLRTSTYTYLSKRLSKEGEVYVLHGYYVYEGNKWISRSDIKRLDPELYGYIEVTRAPDYEIR